MDAAAEALPGRARDGRRSRGQRARRGEPAATWQIPAGSLADWSLVEPAEPVVSAYASGIAVIAGTDAQRDGKCPHPPHMAGERTPHPPEVSRDEETFDGTLTSRNPRGTVPSPGPDYVTRRQ